MDPVVIASAGGGRKQALHFGAPERRLFGFYHAPHGGPWRGAGVVLCAPIGTDHTRSDRTYRHLAERLSASGFACLRFDPLGTGDSGGDEHAPALVRGWIDDVGIALDELRARSGARTLALVGLRLGATVGLLHAAERGDVDSVVLWNPCVSGRAFVAEVTRLHKLYTRVEPRLADASPPSADGEEALGLFLPRAVVDDLSELDLLRVERRPARRALVIDGGNVAGRDALVSHLSALGVAPELRVHLGHKFLVTASHRSTVPDEILDSVVGWLSGETREPPHAPHGPLASAGPQTRPCAPGPHGELPLMLGSVRPLFGIWTPANPAWFARGAAAGTRPAILVTNAGCVNRAGPHRMFANMARRWAQLGFDVLRVDVPGIGDTPAAPGTTENLTYPPSGLDDLRETVRALAPRPVVVAGLCSGGDYAFQLGASEPTVTGAWILNPHTFCILDPASVDGGAPPTATVDDIPTMLRRMAELRGDALLLVSRNDPGIAYIDAHAAEAMRNLSSALGFRRIDLDGSDHTFTAVSSQRRVSDILTAHLTERYGAR